MAACDSTDGADLWIGLMRQPEGSAYGAGVLRFAVTRAGSELYFGTADRVYVLGTDEHQLASPR